MVADITKEAIPSRQPPDTATATAAPAASAEGCGITTMAICLDAVQLYIGIYRTRDRQTGIKTYRQTETDRQKDIQTRRQRDREKHRQPERHTQT